MGLLKSKESLITFAVTSQLLMVYCLIANETSNAAVVQGSYSITSPIYNSKAGVVPLPISGSQTFTINSQWFNNGPESFKITWSSNLVEDDPLSDDRFPFQAIFNLGPTPKSGIIVPILFTLSKDSLNSAAELVEPGKLVFTLDKGQFAAEPIRRYTNPNPYPSVAAPEPLTLLGTGTALGFGAFFKRKLSKKEKKKAS